MQTFPTFTLIHSNLNLQHVTVPPAGLSSAGIFSVGPSSPILLRFPTSATNCRIWQSISTSTPTGQSRVRRMSPASGNLDSVRPVQPRTPLLPVVWARLLPWLSHPKASRITAWHGSSHRMSLMSHCRWLPIPSSPAVVQARRLRSLFAVDSRREHPGSRLTVLSSSQPLHHGPYQIPGRPKLRLWLYTQSFSRMYAIQYPVTYHLRDPRQTR
jgi:hypothetical protein